MNLKLYSQICSNSSFLHLDNVYLFSKRYLQTEIEKGQLYKLRLYKLRPKLFTQMIKNSNYFNGSGNLDSRRSCWVIRIYDSPTV